ELFAPPKGTGSIVVTVSAAKRLVGGAASFSNVDLTTPHGAFVSAIGNSTTASVAVPSAAGELVVDTAAATGDANSLTVGAGQTQRWNAATGNGGGEARGAGSTEPGAASVTMSWTLGASKNWSIGAVSLKPSAVVLAISKADAPDPVAAGSNITYTIS